MTTPSRTPSSPDDHGSPNRRMFLLASSLFLAGCATKKATVVSGLPDPWWSNPVKPAESVPVTPTLPAPNLPTGVISRNTWAKGKPVPARMSPGRRITRITVHHDGMSSFTDTSYAAASSRLESIRRSHLRRKPQRFGDIGYHYAIDPAGRVWGCRPLAYQGAHVGGQNQGNLGIVLLGNYDKQSLNRAQQAAIVAFIAGESRRYGVNSSRIHTHQEMAPTACPGQVLQRYMVDARRRGALA